MAGTAEDRVDLVGRLVKARRLELGHTQQKAAELADVSLSTWNLLETGRRARFEDLTLAQVAKSLGWPPSALARLLQGEDPDDVLAEATYTELSSAPEGRRRVVPDGVMFHSSPRGWDELTEEEQSQIFATVEAMTDGFNAKRRSS